MPENWDVIWDLHLHGFVELASTAEPPAISPELSTVTILRVPGGWIYRMHRTPNESGVFVPFRAKNHWDD